MGIIAKFKETLTSVLPVMAIVVALGLTAAPLGTGVLVRFLIGGVLLIAGLALFLMGVELGIQPIGERSGAALTSKRSLPLLLGAAFVIGFLVTAAEPDIQVFGDQIRSVFASVNKTHLVYMIALGVGAFIVFGLMRTVFSLPLKVVLLIFYAAIFALTVFSPQRFLGIAFDSGGATTGPMTVPFILALGVGVSGVRSGGKRGSTGEDSFGLTGITSIGPILAVLIYGIVLSSSGLLQSLPADAERTAEDGAGIFIRLIPHVLKESSLSIAPLAGLFAVFQLFLLKMPPRQVAKMAAGLLWSFIGLSIFLIGVNGGFMPAGSKLGMILGAKAAAGGAWRVFLIAAGLVLGAVVVCAEPAVWVLTEQVETLSGGTIKRRLMLVFLSAGAAAAIGLAMWRAVTGFPLIRVLLPGYALSLVLMAFCPPLFTAIAFDSGGVASGPITSTFVLSFAMGASRAAGGGTDAFGVISLVAMTPLIAIQTLGIIYGLKKKKALGKSERAKDLKTGAGEA
ncbi:MAG: DUF1538 domain-containing protein [Treponema sp.]